MDPHFLTTIITHFTTHHSHGVAIQAALRKLPGFFFPYDLDAAFHLPFIAPHHPVDPRVLYDLVASQTRDGTANGLEEEAAIEAALSFFLRKLLRRCCMVWKRVGGGTPLAPDLFWGLVAVDTLAGEEELPSMLRHGETLEAVVGHLVAAVVPEGLMASSPQLAMMDPDNGDWEVFRAVKEWMAVGRGGG